MRKKIVGILTLLAMVTFVTLLLIIYSQGIMFQASMLKMTFANLVILVVLCGLHLIESHCKPKKIVHISIWALGIILFILGLLVSYDIIDYKSSWNHLIALGVIYITLVQLQLLMWENSKNLLKLLGFITLLSNLFIIIYFMAKLEMETLGPVLDITVVSSTFAFLFGLILSRKSRDKSLSA